MRVEIDKEITEVVVQKDGFGGRWSIWLDGTRASQYQGLSQRGVKAFLDGLEVGVQVGDKWPAHGLRVRVENNHTLWRVTKRAALGTVQLALGLAVLVAVLVAGLFAIVNVIEVVRIAAFDWDGSHFLEHVAFEIAAVGAVAAYLFGSRLVALISRSRDAALPLL